MSGPFGGPIASPGGCSCCGSLPVCGKVSVSVNGCNSKVIAGAPVELYRQQVISVAVTNGGSGYTSPPAVQFSTTNGLGATATAVLLGGSVDHIDVLTGGAYVGTVAVTLTGGGGTGATAANATLGGLTLVETINTNKDLTGFTFGTHGTNYTSIPNVSVSGGGGTGAVVTANLSAVAISSLVLDGGGSGYTSNPSASVSGGGGSGASVSPRLTAGPVTVLQLGAAGSGYTTGTGYALGFSGGVGGSGVAGTFDVDAGGHVTNLVLTNGGSGYTTNPTVSFPGAGGSGATGTALLGPTSVGALVLALAGSGYTSMPTIAIPPPTSGTTATGHAVLASQNVASLTIVNGGRNFTSTPTVTIDGPGGGGTTATVTAVIATGEESVFYTTSIGKYTISVDGSANGAWWSTTPITQVASLVSCSGVSAITVTLVPVASKVCRCIQCRDPIEIAPILTDSNGSHVMTFTGSGVYAVCYNAGSATGVSDCALGTPATGINVGYTLSCPTTAGGTWNLGQVFQCCNSTTDTRAVPSSCNATSHLPNTGIGTACGAADNQGAGTSPNGCSTTLSFTMGAGAIVPGTVTITL